jgi:hypothetical protein
MRRRQALPVQPGDYRVDVHLKTQLNSNVGTVSGMLKVTTDLPAPNAVIEVPFKANIISDFATEPPAISMKLAPHASINIRIGVSSESGQRLENPQAKILGAEDLTIAQISTREKAKGQEISLEVVRQTVSGQSYESGELLLSGSNGSMVKVPFVASEASPD